MPAVSVIIPTYDCARWLAESLESVLAQTDPDYELIVVDDGSTDDTPDVLARYAGRLTVVRGDHGGLGAARNLGLARATGEWIAFHDADDVAMRDRLAWSREFLREHPEFDAVFGNGRCMPVDDPASPQVVGGRFLAATHGRRLTVTDLFDGFPLYFQGALVPRAAFAAAGPFDAGYQVLTDLEYGYRLLPRLRAACVDHTMFHYRRHDSNITRDLLRMRLEVARTLERLPGVAPGAVESIGTRRVRHRIARQYFRIGVVQLRRGERADAADAFARAARLRPFHPRYRWMQLRAAG
jgi:glycosyltransferase involved in cell wall biosynthesis